LQSGQRYAELHQGGTFLSIEDDLQCLLADMSIDAYLAKILQVQQEEYVLTGPVVSSFSPSCLASASMLKKAVDSPWLRRMGICS
jgi:hypothetical protein